MRVARLEKKKIISSDEKTVTCNIKSGLWWLWWGRLTVAPLDCNLLSIPSLRSNGEVSA